MMLEGIIAGMIYAAAIAFFTESDIQHRNAQVIKEGREVRTGAQCLDREVLVGVSHDLGFGPDTFVGGGPDRGYTDFRAQPISYCNTGLRICNTGGNLIYEVLEVLAASYF